MNDNHKHIGSTFDSLLEEDGNLEEVTIKSTARVVDSSDLLDRFLAILSVAHVIPRELYDRQVKKLRDEAKKELDLFYKIDYDYNRTDK